MNGKAEAIKNQIKNYDLSAIYKNSNFNFEIALDNDFDTLDSEYKKFRHSGIQMCEYICDLSAILLSSFENFKTNACVYKGVDKMFKLVFEAMNSKADSLKELKTINEQINSYQDIQDTYKKLFDLTTELCNYVK